MKELKEIARCWKAGIKIYPVPVDKTKSPLCQIEVNYKGKKTRGKTKYKQDQKLYDKIMEGYEYYLRKDKL